MSSDSTSQENAPCASGDQAPAPPKHRSREPWTKERLEEALRGSLLFTSVSGSFGGLTVRTSRDGKITAYEKPTKPRPAPTARQRAQQSRFKDAAAYAKTVLADPEQRGIYEAAAMRKGISTHNLAMQAYLLPPVIERVVTGFYTGMRRESIVVYITNEYGVSRVQVVIRNSAGALLERGAATQPAPRGTWAYTTRKTLAPDQFVQIEVIATAHAGHIVRKTVAHHFGARSNLPPPPQRHRRPCKPRIHKPAAVWCPDI